jgi:hypothetical protein
MFFVAQPDPTIVKVQSSIFIDWGSPSGSITAGAGAPSGDLGATYYFNLLNFNLYEWNGASWDGPLEFVYSSVPPVVDWQGTPEADPDGNAQYWVQGDESFTITGGIWKRVSTEIHPVAGDVVSFDGVTGKWVAESGVARTFADNTFIGEQTTVSYGPDDIALTVRGVSGQTANLFVVESHDGTDRFVVNNDGYSTTNNIQSAGGMRVGTSGPYATGQRWVGIQDAASVPSSAVSGAVVYVEGGELKVRTSLANVGLTAKRVTTKTDNHTFEGADQGSVVVLSGSNNKTFTVPLNASVAFPIGTVIVLATSGTGHITVSGDAGVSVLGTTVMNTQGTVAQLVKIDTDTWVIHH